MTTTSGSEGGGRVAAAIGEDFGCGCNCWSKGSVVVRGWSNGRGLQAAREVAVRRRMRQRVAAAVVGDGSNGRQGRAAGNRWGQRQQSAEARVRVADSSERGGTGARQLGGAAADVAADGEEWLAPAIEEESNAAVKKVSWNLLGSGRGRATAAVGKEEGKSNVAPVLCSKDVCCNNDDGEFATKWQHGDEKEDMMRMRMTMTMI
ncbi:hypothetical protein BHE74_00000727 [Ensete ventricosum]|nr:hypothetical protein GW17_00002087 [Ensete ventricosum]RWW90125.1 hypothetical protein BHE74_00000727 [Ensete ventricosum]